VPRRPIFDVPQLTGRQSEAWRHLSVHTEIQFVYKSYCNVIPQGTQEMRGEKHSRTLMSSSFPWNEFIQED